jgi:hypothetical protein
MSQKELPRVSDYEKVQQHDNLRTEETWQIAQNLGVLYTEKSIGNMDAQHDAKIIAVKYLDSGYKKGKLQLPPESAPDININAFADVRNQLGKQFFDHMLYKYDVPHDEIVKLATELGQADEQKVNEMKADLVGLLETLHVDDAIEKTEVKTAKEVDPKPGPKASAEKNKEPNSSVDQAVDWRGEVVSLKSKHNNAKEYDKFFVDRFRAYKSTIEQQFKTPHDLVVQSLSKWVMQWWYTKVQQKIDSYNAGKAADQVASAQQIKEWINMSPFDAKGRQEIGVTEDVTQLLKNLQTAKDAWTGKTVEDLSTVPELMNFASLENFLKNSENYLPNAQLSLTVDTAKVSVYGAPEAKMLANSLQKVIDAYENGRPLNGVETAKKMADSMGWGLEKAANVITGIMDQLKDSGAREKIERIFNLLFGDGDFLDRLSALNEMKESTLSPEKTLALNHWLPLIKELPTGEKLDYLRVKGAMETSLFPTNAFDATEADGEWSKAVKTAALSVGGGTYENLLSGEPKVADIMDVSMRAMCAKDLPSYTVYKQKRDANNVAWAQSLFIAKFRESADAFHQSSKDKKLWTKPNETFARALLTTILDTPEAWNWIITAATNETQKEIDAAKLELDALTKDMNVRVDGNKVYLDGVPPTEKVGIKTWGQPVEYNHDQWGSA